MSRRSSASCGGGAASRRSQILVRSSRRARAGSAFDVTATVPRCPRVGVVGAGAFGYHHIRLFARPARNRRSSDFTRRRPDRARACRRGARGPSLAVAGELLDAVDALTVVVPTSGALRGRMRRARARKPCAHREADRGDPRPRRTGCSWRRPRGGGAGPDGAHRAVQSRDPRRDAATSTARASSRATGWRRSRRAGRTWRSCSTS